MDRPSPNDSREDLMAEAVALVERVELTIDSGGGPIVIGFRKDGCASFYFDQDPVYQFNTAGELRRAYLQGKRYKADKGALVALDKRRAAEEVQLVRQELSPAETAEILAEGKRRLEALQAALEARRFKIAGQVPQGADITGRALAWLTALPRPLVLARVPNAR
jgi:hypothetical protein